MKFIKISIGVASLLALISLAAYGQMDTAATDPAAKAAVDPNGDLRVPAVSDPAFLDPVRPIS